MATVNLQRLQEAKLNQEDTSTTSFTHPEFGTAATEYRTQHPQAGLKVTIGTVANQKGLTILYETRVNHNSGPNTTETVTRLKVGSYEAFSTTTFEYNSPTEFRHKWKKILHLAELKAAFNLLTNHECVAGKNSFQHHRFGPITLPSAQLMAPSEKRKLRDKQLFRIQQRIQTLEAAYVFLDLERAAGPLDAEIIQVAAVSGQLRTRFNCYITPRGGIDPYCSANSHKLSVRNGQLYKDDVLIEDAVSLDTCITRFIAFLREVKEFVGNLAITVVMYGDTDRPNLLNSIDSINRLDEFTTLCPIFLNFNRVMLECEEVIELTGGRTSLMKSNILQIITGEGPDLNQAHNAAYDAELLHGLFFAFIKGPFLVETIQSMRDHYINPMIDYQLPRTIQKTRRRRIGNSNPHRIFYPVGFP